ncbi:hypothetical protein NL676_007271 [Syzygium grande]|nr:hypothetical protein NL676_007271 [Syzygium grande]
MAGGGGRPSPGRRRPGPRPGVALARIGGRPSPASGGRPPARLGEATLAAARRAAPRRDGGGEAAGARQATLAIESAGFRSRARATSKPAGDHHEGRWYHREGHGSARATAGPGEGRSKPGVGDRLTPARGHCCRRRGPPLGLGAGSLTEAGRMTRDAGRGRPPGRRGPARPPPGEGRAAPPTMGKAARPTAGPVDPTVSTILLQMQLEHSELSTFKWLPLANSPGIDYGKIKAKALRLSVFLAKGTFLAATMDAATGAWPLLQEVLPSQRSPFHHSSHKPTISADQTKADSKRTNYPAVPAPSATDCLPTMPRERPRRTAGQHRPRTEASPGTSTFGDRL